jgi:hypothetical protein
MLEGPAKFAGPFFVLGMFVVLLLWQPWIGGP